MASPTITYQYRTTAGEWADLPDGPVPDDLATTTTTSGDTVPYIVRFERGTINRAVYEIALLHQPGTPVPDPWTATPGWNDRLVYTFGGACGIGHTQATSRTHRNRWRAAWRVTPSAYTSRTRTVGWCRWCSGPAARCTRDAYTWRWRPWPARPSAPAATCGWRVSRSWRWVGNPPVAGSPWAASATGWSPPRNPVWQEASDVRRAAATLGWEPYYGDRSTQLAIVGLDLDPDSLHCRLEECLLTDLELSSGEEAWRNLPDPFASMFEEDSPAT